MDVWRDEELLTSGQRLADALAWVMWDVKRSAAETSGVHFLLHAGALEAPCGGGVLLSGPPGSGKSTLVASLARAGLGYLTNELVALDLDNGCALPYAKPITVKPGSFDVLADMAPAACLAGVGVGSLDDDGTVDGVDESCWGATEWHVTVGHGTGRAIGRACVPTLVVVPCYQAGALTTLTPLSDTEAFFSLALNAVNLLAHGASGAAALGALVARCTCVRLTMSDLATATNLVLSLLEHHGPSDRSADGRAVAAAAESVGGHAR